MLICVFTMATLSMSTSEIFFRVAMLLYAVTTKLVRIQKALAAHSLEVRSIAGFSDKLPDNK